MKRFLKKKLVYLFVAVFGLLSLSGCGSSDKSNAATKTNDIAEAKNLKIVTTIFPEYDWVREVMGERFAEADVTLLLQNGVDLHSFQPTSEDMVKIATCDLFIYVGGESDGWVDDALKNATNKDMIVLDLMELLADSVKEEEIVEGMEAEEEEEEEGEEEEGPEYDEHVWLSLERAQIVTAKIADALASLDKDHASEYLANAEAYNAKLAALDAEYQTTVEAAGKNTLVFGDRFPFRYMTEDYGLEYFAAFVGCSAETEASFETVTFLANKVDELKLSAICTIEGDDHSIAETVKSTIKSGDGVEIVSFDSMQATTNKDMEEGATYYSIMQENLEVLKKALK